MIARLPVVFVALLAALTHCHDGEKLTPEDLAALKETVASKMGTLSAEGQSIAQKAMALIEQGKTGVDVDKEVEQLVAAAPESVKKEIEAFEKNIHDSMADKMSSKAGGHK